MVRGRDRDRMLLGSRLGFVWWPSFYFHVFVNPVFNKEPVVDFYSMNRLISQSIN